MRYSNEFKRECVRLYKEEHKTYKEVYEIVKSNLCNVNANGFRGQLGKWARDIEISEPMKDASTLGFQNMPQNATVQVDGEGNIKQAWIRSKPENDFRLIPAEVIENQKAIENVKYTKAKTNDRLLEIPFDDMHFGIATFEDYEYVLEQTVEIIESRYWESILIPFGADLLHCDNFNGETGNGTYLGEIDYRKMWSDAIKFYRILFSECVKNSKTVYCYYTQGNHSPSSSWDLLQLFKAWFPQVTYNDEMGDCNLRKVFSWHNIFIGLTHGDTSKSGLRDLKELFIEENKMLYAKAKTIEIHCSHFHHEVGSKDMNGCMARRLPTGVVKDDYHKKKGFTMSKERFQVFEYDHNYIKSFHYINRERL